MHLTARSFPGGDPKDLGGHPHGSLHLQLLVLGPPDEVLADLLQGLHVPGGQGDPDPVHRRLLLHSLAVLVSGHRVGRVSVDSPALNLTSEIGQVQSSPKPGHSPEYRVTNADERLL